MPRVTGKHAPAPMSSRGLKPEIRLQRWLTMATVSTFLMHAEAPETLTSCQLCYITFGANLASSRLLTIDQYMLWAPN